MVRIQAGLGALLLAAGTLAASAEPRELGWDVAPFEPYLTVNTERDICEPYRDAWLDLFNGPGQMDVIELDPSTLPHDSLISIPHAEPDGRYKSLYYNYDFKRHDLDGDGEVEILLFVDTSFSWRYAGPALYIFDTEGEFEPILKRAQEMANPDRWRNSYKIMHYLHEASREAAGPPYAWFGPLRRFDFLVKDGALYTVSNAKPPKHYTQADPTVQTLTRIWPAHEVETVCELKISPPKEQLQAVVEASPFLQALDAMYAGPEQGGGCYGSMGWRGVPPEDMLPDILYRPQARPEPAGVDREDTSHGADMARQLRPLGWGASDPSAWQVFLSLKADQPHFLQRMQAHYMTRFDMPSEDAAAAAKDAWRALTDRVFYARNNDVALARLVRAGEPSAHFEFDAPLDDILDEVSAAVEQAQPAHWQRGQLYGQSLAALVYGGRSSEEILTLYKSLRILLERLEAGDDSHLVQDNLPRLYAALLPAAVTRTNVLAALLEEGVPADGATNHFGKTALMYAAQESQLESARLLLEAGADVNTITDGQRVYPGLRGCGGLRRTHRSALMYAAENASEDVIDLLIRAGADLAATDTQDNDIAWYLARNENLADGPRARILALLSAGDGQD